MNMGFLFSRLRTYFANVKNIFHLKRLSKQMKEEEKRKLEKFKEQIPFGQKIFERLKKYYSDHADLIGGIDKSNQISNIDDLSIKMKHPLHENYILRISNIDNRWARILVETPVREYTEDEFEKYNWQPKESSHIVFDVLGNIALGTARKGLMIPLEDEKAIDDILDEIRKP